MNQFDHKQFRVVRKFWKLFGESIRVVAPDQSLILFAKLKAFKLKEDVGLFADESRSQELLRVKARTIMDIGTIYDVFDTATNQRIGSIKRKAWKSFIQDEWEIWDVQENVIGYARENSQALALIRRFLTNLIPQNFTITDVNEAVVAELRQNFNPFTVRLQCNVSEQNTIDSRLVMVTTIMLAAIEGRQG